MTVHGSLAISEAGWATSLCGGTNARRLRPRLQPRCLTDGERVAIQQLSADIPALWQAGRTTAADRQTIVRCLIERVLGDVLDDSEYIEVTIHWQGGFVSHHEQRRAAARYEQLRDFRPLLERISELKQASLSSKQIAAKLNEEGFRPPKRRATYNAAMVRQLLSRHFGKAVRKPVDGRAPC